MEKRNVFECVMLSRADFEERGYDSSFLTDSDMQNIADRIAEHLLSDGGFFAMIDYYAGRYGLPKL